ncbi:MAG: DNA polymerase III subunit alpha [Humibacillus sp.]|nr:DNA polymerase III subunit alpha [Humibacillus sp.]MDN5778373.1 DNA polymerase III subunit alpha [Humibacillus sp.]
MTDTFVHLHVASGYSMRYGTARPDQLVERAAAWAQPALALTDRDGLYGAVKFATACMKHGVAPVLGVDLALEGPLRRPSSGRSRGPGGISVTTFAAPTTAPARTPVRGGAVVDPRLPRVTVLARGSGGALAPGEGWAALCRLVTATHLRGERGTPVVTERLLAEHASGASSAMAVPASTAGPIAGGYESGHSTGGYESGHSTGGAVETARRQEPSRLVVLLGPDSDVGRAVLAKAHSQARAALERWTALLPRGGVVVEVVCHGGPEHLPGSLGQAGRMLALARELGVPSIITAAVRHLDPQDAAIVDVLDAARRLVPLDTRHLDRVTTAGHLSPTPLMHSLARDVVQVSGPGLVGGAGLAREQARELVARTVALATDCIQDPRADLGIGSVHLPEPGVLGIRPGTGPQQVLARRCRESIATRYPGHSTTSLAAVSERLEDELGVIETLGYATYFLTVAQVCDLIREMQVRVAARGSGAGSLVNYLLGISGVDPMRHGLLMERFCSPLRAELPDIDIDVESARRAEIYEKVLGRFGGERVTCVSMMDTYRVRHAIRDVGAALGLPPSEIDAMAKAFPHIAARNVRHALAELPELRASGLDVPRLQLMFDIVERLDGLPRHIALHPCGVVLSDSELLRRTPVEASWLGFPMSQFDKDDVEAMGLLKLDILGIRMQSAMAYAIEEVERVDGEQVDLDDEKQVPFDDEPTFEMIRSTRTLGCFQIESPGQRELIGKFGPQTFDDLIIDISLFRPGPVKSDMIVPFLNARQGWKDPAYLHPTLIPALKETEGVVVFHEQVLMIVAETTGVSLAEADEVRRALGTPAGQERVERWWRPAARARGYEPEAADRIWEVLKAFASFGFCKAHAAAFALPTYQSAWLKAHHPAAFLAGVLTHDPGMYPKRLILDDARSFGITILGLDVNASTGTYRFERTDDASPGIRLSLADVHGISAAEVSRIVAAQPFSSLSDFWQRAQASRPVVEKLVLAGGFDTIHDIDLGGPARPDGGTAGSVRQVRGGLGRRGQVTRRDLLLHVAELDRWSASTRRVSAASRGSRRRVTSVSVTGDIRALAAAQSQGPAPATEPVATQLTLDLGDTPRLRATSGLPEMTGPERVRAELEVLGLDASGHVVDFYTPMLDALGVTRARDLLAGRSGREVWVAGVKVATQTPPIRTGRRVVFLTLDDATGPVDLTFFEDVQGPYAATVFHSWLLLCRGVVRRTGPKGVSIRATGAWELGELQEAWTAGGVDAARDALDAADRAAWQRAAAVSENGATDGTMSDGLSDVGSGGGEPRQGRRVLVHASGFKQSPYADIKPAGADVRGSRGSGALVPGGAAPERVARTDRGSNPPRKLWHASPGSSGH